MHFEGVKLALDRYEKMLQDRKIVPANKADADPTSLPHAFWMVKELKRVLKEPHSKIVFSADKVHRWLGFLQAILVVRGVTTVAEERNITRPWFTDGNLK